MVVLPPRHDYEGEFVFPGREVVGGLDEADAWMEAERLNAAGEGRFSFFHRSEAANPVVMLGGSEDARKAGWE
jgi:hypothetical protein